MLSGEVPFNSITAHRTAEDIVEDITRSKLSYDSPAWKNVSQAAKDLVKGSIAFFLRIFKSTKYLFSGLLTVDPSKRLTIKDLSRNPWLRGSSIPATHDHQQLLLTPSILSQASRSLIVCIKIKERARVPPDVLLSRTNDNFYRLFYRFVLLM
jgi:serine/threonine protein kinase